MARPALSDRIAFCKLIRELREEAELKQIELAARLGKPQSFVSKFESGEKVLSFHEWIGVCDALEVSPERFLERLNGLKRDS